MQPFDLILEIAAHPWITWLIQKAIEKIPEAVWIFIFVSIILITVIAIAVAAGKHVVTVVAAYFAQYDFDVVNETKNPINVALCCNGYYAAAFKGSNDRTVHPGEVYHANLLGKAIFKRQACYIMVKKSDDNKEIVIPVLNGDIKGSRAYAVRDDGIHELPFIFCNTWHPRYNGIQRWNFDNE